MKTPHTDPSETCLLQVLRATTPKERTNLAKRAGTTVTYLYQLAGLQRKGIKASMALAIEEWTVLMHEVSKGRVPIVSVKQLATMSRGA